MASDNAAAEADPATADSIHGLIAQERSRARAVARAEIKKAYAVVEDQTERHVSQIRLRAGDIVGLLVLLFLDIAIVAKYDVGAGLVAPSIALVLWRLGRIQSQRQQTLELHKEYYSPDFAKSRTDAERFFALYALENWDKTNPYDLPDGHDYRRGYSAVTRYLHRLSVLYEEGEIDRGLAQKLMAREVGFWFGRVYQLMEHRPGMYTKASIFRLADEMASGLNAGSYAEGYADGVERRGKEHRRAWTWNGKRRTTRKGPLV